MNSWIKHHSEKGPELIIFNTRYDFMENPRNGEKMKAVVLESKDSANLVAINTEGKIIMVRQLRFGTGKLSLEVPGGFIDAGEEAVTAAKRELEEESGYTGGSWEYLGKIGSNPVFMDAYVHHFLAKDVVKTKNTQQDDGEDIEVVEMTPDEIREAVQKEEIDHPHSISVLARVLQLWPERL